MLLIQSISQSRLGYERLKKRRGLSIPETTFVIVVCLSNTCFVASLRHTKHEVFVDGSAFALESLPDRSKLYANVFGTRKIDIEIGISNLLRGKKRLRNVYSCFSSKKPLKLSSRIIYLISVTIRESAEPRELLERVLLRDIYC